MPMRQLLQSLEHIFHQEGTFIDVIVCIVDHSKGTSGCQRLLGKLVTIKPLSLECEEDAIPWTVTAVDGDYRVLDESFVEF